jgi:hypothetical protein
MYLCMYMYTGRIPTYTRINAADVQAVLCLCDGVHITRFWSRDCIHTLSARCPCSAETHIFETVIMISNFVATVLCFFETLRLKCPCA